MKKLFISAFGKMTFGTLFLLSVVAANAQSTTSNTTTEQDASQKESPVAVKYLGAQDDMILFNVSYNNPGADKFCLIVKDQDGAALYQRVFNDKSFYKQFRLPKADRNKITFIIRNYKDADIARTFEVNVNSHFVEDVAVKKVN